MADFVNDLFGLDPAIHGSSGAPEIFPPVMSREGGGGWISEPYPHGAEHSRGIWAQAPEGDPDMNHSAIAPHMGSYGSTDVYATVLGWAGDPSDEGGWKS